MYLGAASAAWWDLIILIFMVTSLLRFFVTDPLHEVPTVSHLLFGLDSPSANNMQYLCQLMGKAVKPMYNNIIENLFHAMSVSTVIEK